MPGPDPRTLVRPNKERIATLASVTQSEPSGRRDRVGETEAQSTSFASAFLLGARARPWAGWAAWGPWASQCRCRGSRLRAPLGWPPTTWLSCPRPLRRVSTWVEQGTPSLCLRRVGRAGGQPGTPALGPCSVSGLLHPTPSGGSGPLQDRSSPRPRRAGRGAALCSWPLWELQRNRARVPPPAPTVTPWPCHQSLRRAVHSGRLHSRDQSQVHLQGAIQTGTL